MTLSVSFSGGDLPEVVRRLVAAQFAGATPHALRVDSTARKPKAGWLNEWLGKAQHNLSAEFSDDELFGPRLSFDVGRVVKLERPGAARAVPPVMALLESLPFQLATGFRIHQAWRDSYPVGEMRGFGGGHFAHGWMCAFKGAGHDRLVSRRWLEYGPWKLHRGGADVSLVQFHDLGADADTALAQARPGHERMGISDHGGFLQEPYVFTHELDGEYTSGERLLQIPAPRDVSQLEMLDACAMRRNQVLGAERPVEQVAFVFDTEARARAHLHELWLRELGCWWVDGRLDEDYAPSPAPPAWAR